MRTARRLGFSTTLFPAAALNLVIPFLAVGRVDEAVGQFVVAEFPGLRVPLEDLGRPVVRRSREVVEQGARVGVMHMAVGGSGNPYHRGIRAARGSKNRRRGARHLSSLGTDGRRV